MLDIFVICTEVSQRLDRFLVVVFLFAAVKTLQLDLNIGLGGEKDFQSETRAQANCILSFEIERVRHDDGEYVSFEMNGQGVKRAQETKRQAIGLNRHCRVFTAENRDL